MELLCSSFQKCAVNLPILVELFSAVRAVWCRFGVDAWSRSIHSSCKQMMLIHNVNKYIQTGLEANIAETRSCDFIMVLLLFI